MSHIPYGYRIVDGKAIIIHEEAEIIHKIFNNYLSGMGLKDSAKAAGYPVTHSTVKRILTRKYYLGDSFYPQIIDENTYLQAKNEIDRRAEHFNCCGRTRRKKPVIYTDFEMGNPTESFENPSEQAEYLYSLIEVKLWQT